MNGVGPAFWPLIVTTGAEVDGEEELFFARAETLFVCSVRAPNARSGAAAKHRTTGNALKEEREVQAGTALARRLSKPLLFGEQNSHLK